MNIHNKISKSQRDEKRQHRQYLVIKQEVNYTIVQDIVNKKEFTSKKIYIPIGEPVILYIKDYQFNGNPYFEYSVLNDYKEGGTYLFDVIKEKENGGYLVENNENITLYIPPFYGSEIKDNKIQLTIKEIDLLENKLYYESPKKQFLKNDPEILKEKFKINEKYLFDIKGYVEVSENVSIFQLEREGVSATVKAYDFQNESLIGTQILCEVLEINNSKLKLIQDKKYVIESLYQSNKNYFFRVIALDKDEYINFYQLEDKYGFTHRLYLNFEEDIESVEEGEEIELHLKKIDNKGHLILFFPNSPKSKFYDVESIFKDIGFENKTNEFFYDLKDYLNSEHLNSKAYSNLFELYEDNENTWIFSYLNYLSQQHLKNLIQEKKYNQAEETLSLIRALEEWILEGSDYLSNFKEDTQQKIIRMAENMLDQSETKIEAIQKIRKNEHLKYIDDIINKISLSSYLRDKSISIFKELLFLSNELFYQSTLKVVKIVLFLLKRKELEEYEYKNINYVLGQKIKTVKYQLNNSFRLNRYQLNDEDKEDVQEIIKLLLVQVILDNKIGNKKAKILNSSALFRFYSYLEDDKKNKHLLLLNAAECITKSKGIEIDAQNVNDFDIYQYLFTRELEIISTPENPEEYLEFYKDRGVVLKSNLGFHLIKYKDYISNNYTNSYHQIAGYLNNNILISSAQNLNFKLSKLPTIGDYKEAWDKFHDYTDKNAKSKNIVKNVEVGDVVKVQAKNYLKDNDSIVFLKIVSEGKVGEGILALKDFYSVHLDGFSGIINPGDIFDVEISKIEGTNITFSTKNIICRNDEGNNIRQRFDAIISFIDRENIFLITTSGLPCYYYNDNDEHYNIGETVNVEILSYNDVFKNYDIKILSKIEAEYSIKDILRTKIENNLLYINPIEYNDDEIKNSNRVYIEELVVCIETLAVYEQNQKNKLELYYLLKFISSIIKSSKSYYFDALIKQIETLYKFKKLEAGKPFESVPDLSDETLKNFKSLSQINKSYKLLNAFNDSTSINDLINDEDQYEDNLKEVKELIIANNLLFKNGLKDVTVLNKIKEFIYKKITNEKFDSTVEITDDYSLNFDDRNELEEMSLGKENSSIEFKTSVFYYAGSNSVNIEEQGFIILKTIAGFLNAKGGSLFVGVNDEGYPIGLEKDYKVINGSEDKYERKIRGLIANNLNKDINGQIEFKFSKKDGKSYLEICIPEYSSPVPLKGEFYQRQGNETRVLKGDDLIKFIKRKENEFAGSSEEKSNVERDNDYSPKKHDFYENQKVKTAGEETSNNLASHPIAYLHFYKDNKYRISRNELDDANIKRKIVINEEDKKRFLIQGYDNGCVNKVKIRTILDRRFDYLYSNGLYDDASVKLIKIVDNQDLLQLKTIKDGNKYVKLYEIENISVHEHLHLKGNNLVQDTYDSLESITVISSKHEAALSKLIYKSRQSLGKDINNTYFKEELEYLRKLQLK